MRTMTFLIGAIALAAFIVAVGLVIVRGSKDVPARWHVDPLVADQPQTPNFFRMLPNEGKHLSPVYLLDAETLAQSFDRFALAQPRVERLAGKPEDLFATYVQRSKTVHFPDYISVKFIDLGDGRSTIAVFSRSRYGKSDLGVNKLRVTNWLASLESFVEG